MFTFSIIDESSKPKDRNEYIDYRDLMEDLPKATMVMIEPTNNLESRFRNKLIRYNPNNTASVSMKIIMGRGRIQKEFPVQIQKRDFELCFSVI